MIFSLNTGANLISYPNCFNLDIDNAIPDSEGILGIIGEVNFTHQF